MEGVYLCPCMSAGCSRKTQSIRNGHLFEETVDEVGAAHMQTNLWIVSKPNVGNRGTLPIKHRKSFWPDR